MKIKLSMGKTINLGNYESLRVDVGVEDYEVDITTDMNEDEILKAWTGYIPTLKVELSEELTKLEKYLRLKHSDRAMP